MTENNAAQPGLNDTIRAVFLEHGFTIKHGQTDLKPYVYEAVHALLSKLRAEGVQAGDERALTANQRKEFIRRTSYISEADRDTRAGFVDEIARAALASAPVADERISLLGAANLAFNALHECKPAKGAEKQYSDAIQALQSALHDIAYTVNRTATPQQFADHLQREARAALASASVADESPMAKVAEALREKARQEQQAYQDRRAQATEWGPMPTGTQADDPSELGALADGLESIVGNENAALAAAYIRREAKRLASAVGDVTAKPVAWVAGDDASRYLEWDKERSAWEMPIGTPVFYAAPQASEAVSNALWTLTEHNALHFGEQHNTVIQGRAALKTQPDKDGGDCAKGAAKRLHDLVEEAISWLETGGGRADSLCADLRKALAASKQEK